ncbi:MAG: hypothetical protein QM504_08445 [Pseudomonadota bacterium]
MIYAELNNNIVQSAIDYAITPIGINPISYIEITAGTGTPNIGDTWNGTGFEYIEPANKLIVTPAEFIELVGFPAMNHIVRVTRGMTAYDGASLPSQDLAAQVETAWKYAQDLDNIDLTSVLAASTLNLLVTAECITINEMADLLLGNEI